MLQLTTAPACALQPSRPCMCLPDSTPLGQRQTRLGPDPLLRSLGGLRRVSKLESYVEIDLGGPVSFGSYSYITDAFKLLGSSLLYGRAPCEWLAPDMKAVSSSDPDAIFYEAKMYSQFGNRDLTKLLSSRGWDGLRAVTLGNAFVTPGPLDFLAHHGPSFITEAIPWLAAKLELAEERIRS